MRNPVMIALDRVTDAQHCILASENQPFIQVQSNGDPYVPEAVPLRRWDHCAGMTTARRVVNITNGPGQHHRVQSVMAEPRRHPRLLQ